MVRVTFAVVPRSELPAPRCPVQPGSATAQRPVDRDEVLDFFEQYYTEMSPDLPLPRRLRQVHEEIDSSGSYAHSIDELTFGARLAWRNSARCIGRLYWNSLRVRDRRHVSAPAQVAQECARHLRDATRGGRIRSTIDRKSVV